MALLAVDVGVRLGLAVYGRDGRLRSYGSRNLGNAARLRRAIAHMLDAVPELEFLLLEGGGPAAEAWIREAARRLITFQQIGAERWREQLLNARHRRSGIAAKRAAEGIARRVIAWSEAPRPTSLRVDAAEAILIGLWGVLDRGWLQRIPDEVKD